MFMNAEDIGACGASPERFAAEIAHSPLVTDLKL